MKVFYVRHQAAGVVYEFPFAETPTPEQCSTVLAKVAETHGTHHKKTGEYWSKVVCVEDGVMTTICGCCGESADEVDAKASGHCPIRASGHKRWPDAGESKPHGNSGALPLVVGHGVAHVSNQE